MNYREIKIELTNLIRQLADKAYINFNNKDNSRLKGINIRNITRTSVYNLSRAYISFPILTDRRFR